MSPFQIRPTALAICLVWLTATTACQASPLAMAGGEAAQEPAALDVYLLMGQSNMVGVQPTFTADDKTTHPRVFMLDGNNAWIAAREPVHGVGVGPGFAFGKAMADHYPDRRIGLVPLAVGSTAINVWVKGAVYYNLTLTKAAVARQHGTIKGILWHQGESDSYDKTLADAYQAKVIGLFTDLRHDLNQPSLPVVSGELGHFLGAAYAAQVRAVQLGLPRQLPFMAAVAAIGLTNFDPWHFTAASQRTFGARYAEAMITLLESPAGAKHWQLLN